MTVTWGPGARRARYALGVGLPGVLLLGYLATLATAPDFSFWADGVLGNVVIFLPALICLTRAAFGPAQRSAFAMIGLAALAFGIGNVTYLSYVQFQDPVPYPSLADIGYLVPYPLLLAAVLTLAWPELRGLSWASFLDGALSALGFAVIGSFLVLHPVIADLQGGSLATVVGAAYPVADLSLTALVIAVVTLKGGRPGWTWTWLGGGVVIFAVADSTYLYRIVEGSYVVGTPIDGLWAICLNMMAVAAVVPYRPGALRGESRMLVLPNVFSLVAVAVLVYGSLTAHSLPVYVVVLTTLTLLTAVQRIAAGFAALRQLARVQRQARTDELTQLTNRRHFNELGQQALHGRPVEEPLALLLIDLDRFKAINDNLGHAAGDDLLRQASSRLRQTVRPDDVVARLGGDEFGVLLVGASQELARDVARRIAAALARPYLLDGVSQVATASVGLAMFPEHGAELAVLQRRADLAMFHAKAHRSGVGEFHDDLGDDEAPLDVAGALAGGEFVVHYQPQFDAAGRVYGVEALVRWQHPLRGLLAPGVFLPLLEHAGLMAELAVYVLDRAARERRRWRLDGVDLRLSVNLAPSGLQHESLVGSIARTLNRHGMPPEALTLELTESAPIPSTDVSVRTLHALRELGIQISLDDYGTGWSSLSYLRRLPLDEIKIDGSFVQGLLSSAADRTVVASTLRLAADLRLRAVAEGVEDPATLEALRSMGCGYFQGYLLGRPGPAQSIPSVARGISDRALI